MKATSKTSLAAERMNQFVDKVEDLKIKGANAFDNAAVKFADAMGSGDNALGRTVAKVEEEVSEKVDEVVNVNYNPYINTDTFPESHFKKQLDYVTTTGQVIESNPEITTTIIGTYGQDTAHIVAELENYKTVDFGPRKGGYNVLNTPDELYKSPEQFWEEYNRPWLDNVVERNDTIILATDINDNTLWRINDETGAKELTGFGREIKYLESKGFVRSNDNPFKMVKRGER